MANKQSEEKTSETITISKNDLWKYSTFALLAVLVIGAFFVFNNGALTGNVIKGGEQKVAGTERVEVNVDDAPLLGNKDASVIIVEYSDGQCPFCRKFQQETLPQLKREYIDTGKVAFYHKDFPLGFHEGAETYAEAPRCARAQGGDEAFWKVYDKISEEQNTLDGGTVKSTIPYPGVEKVKQWAQEVGYDIGSCLDSSTYRNAVQQDLSEGVANGIQGTPGFLINGKLLSGAQPFSAFKAAIEAELA